MEYSGERMMACPALPFDFKRDFAVVVSGDGPNFCGHLLLNLGGIGGYYFHVSGPGVYNFPRMMNEQGYRLYLKDSGKKELKRFSVRITKSDAAMLKLEQLLSAKWLWGVLPHNCASFVEEIVAAGGGAAGLYTNCPALEHFE
jgi:hypothetical protein